jgi:hypothetical protein
MAWAMNMPALMAPKNAVTASNVTGDPKAQRTGLWLMGIFRDGAS